MYKKTASADQFFSREAMHSTKGSRRGYDLLNQGESVLAVLTPEEQRASLVAQLHTIDLQLLSMGPKDLRRKELGRKKHALQNQITELRPKLHGPRETINHFISVARERLPKALYNAIMTEATERARKVREEMDTQG